MYWKPDVTFRENVNATFDKMSVQDLNIFRKYKSAHVFVVSSVKKILQTKKKYSIIVNI